MRPVTQENVFNTPSAPRSPDAVNTPVEPTDDTETSGHLDVVGYPPAVTEFLRMLRSWRDTARLTRGVAAKRLWLSRKALDHYECGYRIPPPYRLKEIFDLYKVSSEECVRAIRLLATCRGSYQTFQTLPDDIILTVWADFVQAQLDIRGDNELDRNEVTRPPKVFPAQVLAPEAARLPEK